MDIDDVKRIMRLLTDFDVKIKVGHDHDVLTATTEHISKYISLLEKFDSKIASKAEDLHRRIDGVFDEYFVGNLNGAAQIMEDVIVEYQGDLFFHDLDHLNNDSINIYEGVNEFLYKGRSKDWRSVLKRKDMLHIPFDKRSLVQTQRFSMPGIPCLYLGQSLLIVWEELNRPSFEHLFLSRYKIDPSKKFLDIGVSRLIFSEVHFQVKKRGVTLLDYIKDASVVFNKILLTMVLTIACSVSVNNPESFRTEYIIPQLLLMAVMNKTDAFGIRYSSTRMEGNSYILANYAIPAMSSKGLYDQNIIDSIELTQPVNLGLYNSVSKDVVLPFPENYFRDLTQFSVADEYKAQYSNTEFYEIEMIMNGDPKLILKKAEI